MTLICCRTYDTVDNYACPDVSGTLLNFDLSLGLVSGEDKRKGVSSGILKFSRGGDLVFVRFKKNGCLAILDADDFRCYQTISYDVTSFPPFHCSFYRLFPLISKDDTKVATLQWINNRGVMRTTTIQHRRVQTLKSLCRQVVLKHLNRPSKVHELAVPGELKEYLLWM